MTLMIPSGRRFYTSDLHFGHARINELAGRPFKSVEEMNDELVRRWNETVGHTDQCTILGDLAMGNLQDSLDRVSELHGIKVLLPGNHDRVSSLYRGSPAKKEEWTKMYEDAGLFIADEELKLGTIGDGVSVVLSHFPYEGDSHGEDRYKDSRPVDNGGIVWHGHVHEAWKQRGRQINVGVDVWDFYPVPEEKLVEMSLNTS